ncbi:MAG: protein-L-isoaspartate(D-aspartate) O-methyltransferase [Tenacibaculum sp.]
MKDTAKHQGLRNLLVKKLQAKGITDIKVLEALRKIPRHLFLDSSFESHAYQDKAFPIIANQTISQPYTVAFQTQALEVQQADKVLEIGTGSGYQAAVLSELKAEVYTVERQHKLFKNTSLFLPKLGYRAKCFFGDGFKGLPKQAPFDKIIVTAGAPFVPKALLTQIRIGGKLLIPIGDKKQIMTLFIRKSLKEFEKHELGFFKFVPMLMDKN